MEQVKGRRLILFPMPFQGHINPMLELANILHSKGFSITILHTTFNPLDPSIHPHFKFHSIPVSLSESEASTKNLVHLFNLLNAKLVEPFKDYLASLLSDDLNSEPVACLISDSLLYFTQPVAENLKLPRLVLKTGCVTCINVFAMFPLLREKGYLPVQDARLKEPVKELPPLKVKDLPVVKGCDPSEYYDLVVPISSKTQASDGLIFNTFEDLEETSLVKMRQELLPNVPIFPIGPFHRYSKTSPSLSSSLSQDQTCISWLNNQAPNSVIYVSFGTIAKINQAQFLEVAWGLVNSNQPFLWVVRAGLVNSKGHIVKWAAQKEILAHPAVGAFWTHNGWNSTLESICEGVPMISTPCFNDQMVIARYVSEVWKVGLWLEDGIERGLIEKTIRKLMVEKEGKEIKERMSKLKVKANRCLKHGGSSDQSLEELVKYISSFKPFGFHTSQTVNAGVFEVLDDGGQGAAKHWSMGQGDKNFSNSKITAPGA